ncbi:MAG: DNA polymerase [Cyanobacteria bacterium P01_H01_bin.105]
MPSTLMQTLDARPTKTEFKFPEISPVVKPAPFSPDLTPKLEYFPLEDYPTLKSWVEAIALAQWDYIEEEVIAFIDDEKLWLPYPKEAEIPYESGWYFYDGTFNNWEKCLSPDSIPHLIVADTESCRQTEESPYRPFLFGGLTRHGWYLWHCNDDELPTQVPFPPGRIVIGHNFSDYDSRFLSCEQSTANGRRTTILDTLSMLTRYQGLSNQQTGRYKTAHAAAKSGKPADPWYQHACEGGLDHAVEKLLGVKIDKGVRDAMTENLWMQLYDVKPPKSIFEYWAQDVLYTARLFKKLYLELRYNFLPATTTWVGMAEMAGCRVWLKDWEGFLEDSDRKWRECKDYLAGVVKSFADMLLQSSDGPELFAQYKTTVLFEAGVCIGSKYKCVGPDNADIVVRELPDDEFDISIFPMDKERSFIFRPDPDGTTYSFGKESDPSEAYLKKERALHQSLKRIAANPSCLRMEQGDLITKLAAVFPEFQPTLNKSGCFDWTPARNGPSKGQPKWYKDLSSTGTKKNPKNPFSIGTQVAVYLLEICWDNEPIRYRKIGNKGGWIEQKGVPLPHPSGGDNLGTPFCKDYLAYATAGKLTSRVLPQEDLVEIYRNILLSGQWTQFRSRYHDVYTHESKFEGLKFVKPAINPAGTVTGRAKSGVWVVTPNEKEIFDGSIKIGSDIQNCVVAPPGYKVVGADFTSQESWLATLLTDAQAGKVGSSPWCQSVLYGDKKKGTDIHSIVAKAVDIPRQAGKILNFSKQYGAGVQKLILTLMLAGVPFEIAEHKAQQFVTLLQGPDGIARTTFGTLRELSQIPAIRTNILGCRVPESLDHSFCGRNFITTRQNWLIQSAGTDCIHALLTILNIFLIEYEIDAILLLHRHDAVYFAVKDGQEEIFKRCLQQAHYLTKQLAYEQAVEQANQLNKAKGHTIFIETPPLECPDSQKWFDEVKVVDCVGAAG